LPQLGGGIAVGAHQIANRALHLLLESLDIAGHLFLLVGHLLLGLIRRAKVG
jgi:hypothetical protein